MSNVTSVVIHVDVDEDEDLGLEEPLPFDHREQFLCQLPNGGAGGREKRFGESIYAGAFNFLDWDAFVAWVAERVKVAEASAVLSMFGEESNCVVVFDAKGNMRKADTWKA